MPHPPKVSAPARFGSLLLIFLIAFPGFAQDDSKPRFKQLPPKGIEVDFEALVQLTKRVDAARTRLNQAVEKAGDSADWRSDVDVLIRAVSLAVEQELFFKKNQVRDANRLIDEAERRIEAAIGGTRGLELLGFDESKNDTPQPLAGGFVSRIDGSVQPVGIVVPAGFTLDNVTAPHRMDVWLHGRGDTKTEVPFLTERLNKTGLYTPKETFVVHPFGRHCNAFKFAGETDVYEAMAKAETLFEVDTARVAIRGFSMGGAACWHLAVHDPTRWFAANPGAGFVDTLVYQGWKESTPFEVTPTAEKLLKWYDVLPWTANLRGVKTIAYSGEVDKQKQAADRVVEQATKMGLTFPYVIGPAMGHRIDEDSQEQIDGQLLAWEGSLEPGPAKNIDFVTYSTRYSNAGWLRVTGMKEHWTPAVVKASLDDDKKTLAITTDGVTHLEVNFSQTGWPGRRSAVEVEIDGQKAFIEDGGNRAGFQCRLARLPDGEWTQQVGEETKRKRPGIQGPIDDAFCDRFIFVLPSRPARHGRIQRWISRETEYAQRRWRRLMRGDVQFVLDREITEEHIENCHLICFGDFSSNRFLFRIAEGLPITWTREELKVGGTSFDPSSHAPVFCYPNPLNPNRYVVVNSGMTFREFSNVSNSRQIAMLPDWAVLDVTEEDDSIYAGGIRAQGFFDESWNLPLAGIKEPSDN
ncbi:MAG: prolyl oligopeptidase family serine peptidase [Planctomycetota bacterium]